ncbi:hypothetical protein D3C87_1635360 [compost metagenome]
MLLLSAVVSLVLFAMRGAVVHDAPQSASVIAWVLRRTPYRRDTELAAAASLVVIRTINPPPSVTAADFDAPTLTFSVLESFLDFFLRV